MLWELPLIEVNEPLAYYLMLVAVAGTAVICFLGALRMLAPSLLSSEARSGAILYVSSYWNVPSADLVPPHLAPSDANSSEEGVGSLPGFCRRFGGGPCSVSPPAAAVSSNWDAAMSVSHVGKHPKVVSSEPLFGSPDPASVGEGHFRGIMLGALVRGSDGCAGIPIDEAGQTSNFDLHDDLVSDALIPLQQGGFRVIDQGLLFLFFPLQGGNHETNQGVEGGLPITFADVLMRGIDSELKDLFPLARRVTTQINSLLRAIDKSAHKDEALHGLASFPAANLSPRTLYSSLKGKKSMIKKCSSWQLSHYNPLLVNEKEVDNLVLRKTRASHKGKG
ncbi:hypothetical protein Nepgr_007919 [Nepenthes gracilis]|uniref:Uncharacterized protein n=1 Tax=Nepenthes gracilis TaxID=150966 RepID=A0AAD3S804_NEPGR|nr:hypothetical protein Nepgr_007919 [Nepenthes gracilis]